VSNGQSSGGPPTPGEVLRILLVEDVESDAELMQRELRKANIACTSLRVQTEVELRHALHHFQPDVVLSDHSLPHFTGQDALRVVQTERPQTPVVIVTGSLDEETAADYIKGGAVDYVVKERLHRLGPAVRRALALRQAEDQLRRTTEFMSLAQTVVHIGTWEWDIVSDVVTWSDETYRIFGVARAGKPMSVDAYLNLIHPDDRDAVKEAVSRALEGREPFEVDHRIIRPDSDLRFLYGRGAIVRDSAGRPERLIGAVLDISGRKQAEETLRRANDRLQAIIQSSPLAILSLDAQGIVQTWNPAAERLFGWTVEEAMGGPLPIVPDENQEFREAHRRVMQGESLTGVELVRRKKDDTVVSVNLFAAPLHDADGHVTEMLALIEDLTGVKRLEQQFLQAQKMEAVGRLAGGIAHDFNNLLTAILGSTELLLEMLPADHPGREEATETQKAALRAAELTRQLLAFSRQQVLAPRVLSLNEAVAGTEKMLRRLLGEDVDLHTLLADDLSAVRADPGQLEQVIVNLAVNARDAMPTGGKLTIETANVTLDEAYGQAHAVVVPGSYVMLVVSDTGMGMDAATQARLFEPFFTTKPKGKGTGLGLATVYGIVKQSGGYVWAYSEPGRGTTFKIYLPRVDAPVESASAHPAVPGSLHGAETILVVEDQEEVRKVIRRMLEARGYRVLVAPSGPEALRIGRELETLRLAEQHGQTIDLLVTDVVMPGMNGREVALLLAPSFPKMKVLYLSGYTDESIVRHGMLEPGIAFLQKPFNTQALARKVRDVLDAPRDA
jgi:two-component system cell cycle sensor histidine kinase/response regulator CckA